ncbi:MAG TPA: hypothetical protein VF622_10215, partial [Segetibacter sp.]
MQKGIFVFLMLCVCSSLSAQKPVTPLYVADNGILLEGNVLKFGGTLKRSTLLDGSFKSLSFNNLDSFYTSGSVNHLNSSKKTIISSNDLLNLTSQNILLSAASNIGLHGSLTLGSYRNNTAMDSVLTVDASGNLKLVKQAPSKQVDNGVYGAENGLSIQNNLFSFGGQLKRATNLDANNKSLRFTNVDTFFVGGRHVQLINSAKNTTISSFGTLNLLSIDSMVLSANNVVVDGGVRFSRFKNSANLDSVLTVDNCGNLKMVSQGSLQTIAQNAFINNGNSFGAAAYLGTNDKNFLYFKTNKLDRGYIDTAGIFNYNYGVNINNSKLKVTGNIELNGLESDGTGEYKKAVNGINFADGDESLARGTISYNLNSRSMNYTSNRGLHFYSGISGVPYSSLPADLTITEGLFRFGGRNSTEPEEASAAYQFKTNPDGGGKPRGVLFPRVSNNVVRDYQLNPAIGLIFFNSSTGNLQIKKSDGWHNFLTQNENVPVATLPGAAATTESITVNNNSYVQALGDGQQKSFKISHNLNAQFVMVQFIDCGPEANCNLLQILPKGARVELDGKNNALV